jgi:transglutaminase-like putative cysteine protease
MTKGAGMRFQGSHVTTYRYSAPVYLKPHTVRLRPRPDPGQIVHGYEIRVSPEPSGMTSGLDAWGNSVEWVWFSGEHSTLEITTTFDAERTRLNPYDFIVTNEDGACVPPIYTDYERAALQLYLTTSYDPGDDVRKLADDIADEVSSDILEFPRQLAVAIQSRCEMIVRPQGDPYRGAELLAEGRGSCRDMAVLFIEACRHVGIASRFVSGYVGHHDDDAPRDLHAWAGVYMPGGGWRGFDPTQGLAVSAGHITLAVADTPAGAAPVTGSFAGANGAASSDLDTTIEFEVSPS